MPRKNAPLVVSARAEVPPGALGGVEEIETVETTVPAHLHAPR